MQSTLDRPSAPTQTETTTPRPSSRRRRGKNLFVAAAGVSFLFSVGLWFSNLREEGLFVGLWVPSILSLGAVTLASRKANS